MINNRFEKLFNEMLNRTLSSTPFNLKPQKAPEVNVYQNENGYELHMKVPGIDKENINIAVENRVLTLNSKFSENEKYVRSFELPENVDNEKINAKMENGILILNIPKAEEKKAQRIEILDAC